MLRRQFLGTSTAIAASTLAAPAVWAQPSTKLTPLKFTLDFRVTGQTAPFFLAQAQGYYRDEGLDVSIDVGAGSVTSITRVASGVYQLGLGDISSLTEFQAQNPGTPVVQAVYQYYNRAPFVIIGRKDRGITSDFQSLKGKRIAAAAVESTRRAWPMVANKLKLGADHFQWVTTDFSARDNVMVRGDVDGATYFHDSAVSLFARMKAEELSVLKYTEAGVNLYGNAVLASRKLITEQPALVAGFLRASNRALKETLANPTAAIAAIKQREPILDEQVELERWRLTAQYVAAPDVATHGLGDVRKALLEEQITQVAQVFGLQNRPNADNVFERSLLPTGAERAYKA
ncbi:ABC transporter permease [Hylemonella gracilis str. Niagara R]|uniref:ABC transporter permease n=1 Tax=Hylemonella gracilis str. Niagara R TaxID=1458275 RepID=A0A016XJ81_9BURK|nr:ABC transporter substrate-binding protein [Hylemonella gracilis]EYC51283.1 ABC transporter permease [Hylemonella gracilis str. Niagara R]